jgi:putative hydrolase of HD superfamily
LPCEAIRAKRGDCGADGKDAVNARVYSGDAAADRLGRQMAFIREIDKLKSVYRRTLLMDGARFENDAEHSWHLAVMAALLAEYANDHGVDIGKVIRMVLAHDIVEIDAGDTYCYDTAGHGDKAARETRAAERLFGLLPDDQAAEWRALWEEFEARETPEAKFAAALDRVQPLLHNFQTQGIVWRQHGITSERVTERNHHVVEGSKALWTYAEGLIREAVSRGYLEK